MAHTIYLSSCRLLSAGVRHSPYHGLNCQARGPEPWQFLAKKAGEAQGHCRYRRGFAYAPLYLCRMEFQKKKYTFRGMDGYAGFRQGKEYELELGMTAADDERPAEVVIVNPVSKLWMYCSKQEFTARWEKR